ncbi:hypothetical protein [Amphritea balenae]|uniref:Uncharacterized protein n=1 Tax=Amphritea balenae TaxID=452629 RepID=A0A3P1SJ89_9GAMM|nr:hypothetical protein [Amphritea balenae]RRC97117.1 hypothetical protein EHS89_19405 [Amphritea balenae]GGK68124.1 hypothetical protein GCM10007941_17890 [Amphritea balenae]
MQVQWNENQLNTFNWIMTAFGAVVWGIYWLMWELGFEHGVILFIFAFVGSMALMTRRWTRNFPKNNRGATASLSEGMFKFNNPNSNLYIEFAISDIEKVFVLNYWFFSYMRLSMKNKKYFTLYFYDVRQLQSELINLKVITKTGS